MATRQETAWWLNQPSKGSMQAAGAWMLGYKIREHLKERRSGGICPQCDRDLHGYRGPLCRYCDGTAE